MISPALHLLPPLPGRRRALGWLLLAALAAQPAGAATTDVAIRNFAFSPAQVSINTGDTVKWTQDDGVEHTTTSTAAPPLWDSGGMAQNTSFTFAFPTAGTFDYICSFHPFMQGSVRVAAAANVPPTVQLTSPATNALFALPAAVVISATASDPDDTVSQVEFLDGTNVLGVVATAPYTLTATNLAAGVHTLTAKATDSRGAETTSVR